MAGFLLVGSSAFGAIEWTLNYEFSEATQPEGYLFAKLENVTGGVQLTLESHLAGSEFVGTNPQAQGGWLFNVASAFANGNLNVSEVTRSGSFLWDTTAAHFQQTPGNNEYRADGDGLYDFRFIFSNSGGATDRFGGSDRLVVLLSSSVPGLDETDFQLLSEDTGGKGPFYVAAHVQSIGPNGESGWITVPEPSTVIAGALLLLPFAASTVRFMRKNRTA